MHIIVLRLLRCSVCPGCISNHHRCTNDIDPGIRVSMAISGGLNGHLSHSKNDDACEAQCLFLCPPPILVTNLMESLVGKICTASD